MHEDRVGEAFPDGEAEGEEHHQPSEVAEAAPAAAHRGEAEGDQQPGDEARMKPGSIMLMSSGE